ncbi:MAG: hypothetical protein KDK91_22925 [Gammaproteobacteria bacterium]|nr:hypothetical protein [Gammaproteobacteria bacterium]
MSKVAMGKFLSAYGSLITTLWGDPDLKDRFLENPAPILKDFGLDPGDAQIRLLAPGRRTEDTTPESQVRLWNDGLDSGSIDFYFPEEPPEGQENMEISESALEAVAGGGTYCCCCTPCCSC